MFFKINTYPPSHTHIYFNSFFILLLVLARLAAKYGDKFNKKIDDF